EGRERLPCPHLPAPWRLAARPAVGAEGDVAGAPRPAGPPRGLGDRAALMWQGVKALRAFERG
ncbi:MAG: hypothetical protein ABF677_03735, partial [Acetobacter sp.]